VATKGFQELVVYQRAGELADAVRASVHRWSHLDCWTAGVQLIRALDSVPANIAEATGRESLKDQARFYVIARGSLREAQQWLVRADARALPLPAGARERAEEVGKMLSGLIRSTDRDRTPGTRN
jgi:four helix bundle protein